MAGTPLKVRWVRKGAPLFTKVRSMLMGNGAAKVDDIEGVVSREEFQKCLDKERARADRLNGTFTTLVFEIAGIADRETSDEIVALLAKTIVKRARKADTVGWFEERLGLILAHTGSDRVPTVWKSIQDAFEKRLLLEMPSQFSKVRLRCSAYGYPISHARSLQDKAARETG